MKPAITVVSLGPGDSKLLTLQSADLLRKSRCLVLRTSQHRVAAWLQEEGIAFEDFDALYGAYEDFDALHAEMARRLWEMATEQPVTFAVIDAQSDGAVRALRATCPAEGKVSILPGVTMADSCLAILPDKFEQPGKVRILPAMDAAVAAPDPAMPLLITELFDRVLASDVKLHLSDLYGDEAEVVFFPSSAKISRKPIVLPLMELDRQRTYDHTVCLFVPAMPLSQRPRYCFADLLEVMRLLRQRCPWDSEQTHESLRKYLIEEAYEAVGAIDEGDMDHLADELGDVLLQIAFHADIAQAVGEFSISDVTTAIVRKLIYRHAHIFGDIRCDTAEDVAQSWEQLKKAEKGLTTQASVLADVSQGLPALMRAAKVQKKASQVGFDWDDALGALPKVHEEAEEVRAELETGRDPGEELGDLLFSCVNVARLAGLEPELLLKSATEKFIRRFTAMENLIICDEKSLEGLTLAEMDVYWNRVKQCGDMPSDLA
ncbi:MAG: nucleoside triphosphate pyrophosphohydrolase [Clostridiales bacterium]|nr:nucleoside triphosphate pyrophosphohydrolase [Clostridiales bacterium]